MLSPKLIPFWSKISNRGGWFTVVLSCELNHSKPSKYTSIDGNDVIIEIDESVFAKIKHYRGKFFNEFQVINNWIN